MVKSWLCYGKRQSVTLLQCCISAEGIGQQSEYASCNASLLNSLNIYCSALGIPYLTLGVTQPALVPVGKK